MKRVVYYKRKNIANAGKKAKRKPEYLKLVLWAYVTVFLVIGSYNSKMQFIPANSILGKISALYYRVSISRSLFDIGMSTLGILIVYIVFNYIASLSSFGIIENCFMLGLPGFVIGQTVGSLYLNFGIKGVLYALCIQIPPDAIMFYIMTLLSKSSIKLSAGVLNNVFSENKIDLNIKIQKHGKLSVYSAVLSMLCMLCKVICCFVFSPYIHLQ